MAKIARNESLGLTHPPTPEAEHPVILRHPDSGREILYVSPGIPKYIIVMREDESDDLLKQLHTHSTRPSLVYSHDWHVGDMIMSDTPGTLLRRDSWNRDERGVMRQLSTLWDASGTKVSITPDETRPQPIYRGGSPSAIFPTRGSSTCHYQ